MFPPAPAVRYRVAGFTGTPMPKDEPMAPNPPFGANIDYVLNGPATMVVLEIMDGEGTVIRRWQSDEKPHASDPAKLTIAPEWVTPQQTLSNASGHHRFVWSLRYQNPTGLEGRRGGEGIWAPPGHYRAALTVDGRRIVVPFDVVPDPRVNLPASAYTDQFALARAIEAEREKLAVALKDAGAQIPKLEGERRTRAIEISGVDPATADAWWLFPKSTATLRFAADKLAALQSAVDGADAAPTQDARESFAKLKAIAEEALGRWENWKRSTR
jgi:hypothetical protein